MTYHSSEGRAVTITSPKAGVTFNFRKLKAKEFLSKGFEIDLEVITTEGGLEFKDFGGQCMGVEIKTKAGNTRHFHGYIIEMSRISGGEGMSAEHTYRYHIKLAPWSWFLTQRVNCRIFNSKDLSTPNSVKDIIKKVYSDAGFSSDYDQGGLSETYPSLNYVVQYNESDADFFSRMLEREGIYYYFEHKADAHKLMLADSPAAHASIPGYEEIPFNATEAETANETIGDWVHRYAVRSGGIIHRDYDPTDPTKKLEKKESSPGDHSQADHERYEYPGLYSDPSQGVRHVKARLAEHQFGHEVVSGKANSLGLVPGYNFKLVDHTNAAENAEYTVVSCVTEAESSKDAGSVEETQVRCDKYTVSFAAIPCTDRYHPPRVTPVPRAVGPHTAVVVGQSGEEITTDEFGRVKVQFHWDREGKNDQDSSCWVRVAQTSAFGGWGALVIPRHGMEVIVEFIDADLERPIVTGCVYNGKNEPPFGLPDNATQSGIKTHSSKGGAADNFNEIRLEDKKDEELFFIQAEKDAERVVKNNDKQTIGLETTDPGDQTIEIHNDRTVTLNEGNDKLEVKKGDQTIDVKKKILIKAGDEITLETGSAKIVMKKDGTINIDGKDITIKGTGNVKVEATANFDAKGMKTTVTGTTSTFEGSGTCDLKGGMVNIN